MGVAILATLTLNYGTKITSNQKHFCHSFKEVQNIQSQQNLLKGYRHFKKHFPVRGSLACISFTEGVHGVSETQFLLR